MDRRDKEKKRACQRSAKKSEIAEERSR